MKILLLLLPLLSAVEHSSSSSSEAPDGKHSFSRKLGQYFHWLLLAAAGVVAFPLVRAEQSGSWHAAQACLMAIFLLLALAGWNWWHINHWRPRFGAAPEQSTVTNYRRALWRLVVLVVIGVGAILVNANREKRWEEGLVARGVGYGILIAGFTFIAGVLLGFLFGIPPSSGDQSRVVGSSSEKQSPRHPAQTNLEEIADWLTKIILGAGLVQLAKFPDMINRLSVFIAKGVEIDANPAVALAVMGYFSSCGLLYGYLWTRYNSAVCNQQAGAPARDDGMSGTASGASDESGDRG